MKKAFQIHKAKPKISVILTRDSVCAGDDCDAPHEKTIEIHSFVDPKAFTRHASSGYIPSVDGFGHSWLCVLNDIEIAEITAVGIKALAKETNVSENNRVHFKYKSARY